MKKVVKYLLVICSVLIIAGCGEIYTAHLVIEANDEQSEKIYSEKDGFAVNILGEDYEFEVTKVTAKEVTIEVDRTGLNVIKEDGKINKTQNVKTFKIEKGKTLELGLQSLDGNTLVKISWDE